MHIPGASLVTEKFVTTGRNSFMIGLIQRPGRGDRRYAYSVVIMDRDSGEMVIRRVWTPNITTAYRAFQLLAVFCQRHRKPLSLSEALERLATCFKVINPKRGDRHVDFSRTAPADVVELREGVGGPDPYIHLRDQRPTDMPHFVQLLARM